MSKKLTDRQKAIRQLDAMSGVKIMKKKKRSMKAITKELWELCKKLTRRNYKNVCFTCGATGLSGSNWHTGHFIPSSVGGAFLRYDLRNLRPQCYNCNINAGGNGAIFYQRMVATEGQAFVDLIMQQKDYICDSRTRYEEQIEAYKKLCV